MIRKKLKWPYEPFKIPQEILNHWRKIGEKGIELEKEWLNSLNNSSVKIKEKFNSINNKIFKDELNDLIVKEKEKFFQTKPSLATRQCQ